MHKPSIDSKVCNKKVGVDDRWPFWWSERGDGIGVVDTPARSVPWSCVDYADEPVERKGKGKMRPGENVEEEKMSQRFANVKHAYARREDTRGTCREMRIGNDIGIRLEDCEKMGEKEIIIEGMGGASWTSHTWYTKKQTNRGWPGTAEGKINTAQGMAGSSYYCSF